MTKKLFYENSYLEEFEGTVLSCEAVKEGYSIVLDQTAFYPEGGGQPSDIGKLDEAKVSYVSIKDEVIYHITDKPLTVGRKVYGKIDFNRRYDFMQQHSGEHIVSGLIKKHFGYNNVGFHLSDTYMTADLSGEITKEQLLMIEQESNEAVFKNIPIKADLYDKKQIESIDYRSKIEIKGKVRLVEIEDYDICACCGTHVGYTGEIGLIKCTNLERHRGGVRITILCGKRALNDYNEKQGIVSEAMGLLSAKPQLVTESIKKLQEELNTYKQKLAVLKEESFRAKAKAYAKVPDNIIFVYEEDLTPDDLRRLSLILIEYTEKMCLILTGEEGAYKYALGAKCQDVRPLCKRINTAFNGRGGGKEGLCQGNISCTMQEIKNELNNLIDSE